MKYKIVIKSKNNNFPLRGLNELLGGRMYNPRTRLYHNPVKKSNDRICLKAIKKCVPGLVVGKPIKCVYWIYAADKRHDRSNLYAAIEKSFLDALQLAKVIKNDSWEYVHDSEFHTEVDKDNPRIEVEIIEILESEGTK